MPEVGVKEEEEGEEKREGFIQGTDTIPVPHTPPSEHIPLSIPLPKKRRKKKKSINKRTVVQIGEGMSRFSMGFQEKAQGAEIFCFCLPFKWV